jgi:hypothetical protein
MKKKIPPADNPTSAIFDLAEHMSDNYERITYLKYYAYIFISITIILLVILSIFFLIQGNIPIFIIIIAIIISGIMLLRLVIFTISFLDDFNTNFIAIKNVREIDPIPKIPKGKNQIERLEIYLKNHDPGTKNEIKNGFESARNHMIDNIKWPLVLYRQPRSFGLKGFLTVVQVVKKAPKMADFIKFEKDLEQTAKEYMIPNRAILLCKAPMNYDGISDDLYSYLTEKNHYIMKNGNRISYKLQLFVETEGRYEIIPLIP